MPHSPMERLMLMKQVARQVKYKGKSKSKGGKSVPPPPASRKGGKSVPPPPASRKNRGVVLHTSAPVTKRKIPPPPKKKGNGKKGPPPPPPPKKRLAAATAAVKLSVAKKKKSQAWSGKKKKGPPPPPPKKRLAATAAAVKLSVKSSKNSESSKPKHAMSGFLTSPVEVSRLPVIRGEFPLQQVLLHLSTQTREVLDLTPWEPMCTDETIARICACNKNVKSFTLQNSNLLTASGLQLLLRYQRRLRTLDLSKATKISFPTRFDFTCGITCLDLSNSVISDSDLGHLPSCCPHLTTLKLVSCSGVSSVGVRYLAKKEGGTARLNSVDLTDCSAVDDAGVVALVTRLKHMIDLRLSGLDRITEQTLTAIINNCQVPDG